MFDPDRNARVPPNEIDPEHLTRLLEVELRQKRAEWQQAAARNRSIRVAGFVFLFIIVAACVAGFFFMYSTMNEQRSNRATPASRTPGR